MAAIVTLVIVLVVVGLVVWKLPAQTPGGRTMRFRRRRQRDSLPRPLNPDALHENAKRSWLPSRRRG
jgi:hypothetical protein